MKGMFGTAASSKCFGHVVVSVINVFSTDLYCHSLPGDQKGLCCFKRF